MKKIKEILFWVLIGLQIILLLSVFKVWFDNDKLTQMQIFKEMWWVFFPSLVILILMTLIKEK